jgi:hypothetical protein
MAITSAIPGAAGGAVTGRQNMGIPVTGNLGGNNQYSPPLGTMTQPTSGTVKPGGLPGSTPGITGQPPVNTMQGPNMNMTMHPTAGLTPQQQLQQQNAAAQSGNPIAPGAAPSGLDKNMQKQLIDIYGKGTGGMLAQLIQNLGSSDSSYLDAYRNAMAGQQAKDISTIGTSLGNAGISANSSTSAIEKGTYLAQSNAQMGLQEQQLIQSQQQQLESLVTGTQQDAKSEVASSWLDTFGQVADIAGTFIGDATGFGAIGSGIKSAASMIPGFGGKQPPSIAQGGLGEGQLGNPFTAGAFNMPGMGAGPATLPTLGV